MKKESGTTIITLAITIIVLAILTSVSITALTGDNGMIQIARQSKENMEQEQLQEKIRINELQEQLKNGTELGWEAGEDGEIVGKTNGSYSAAKGVNTPKIDETKGMILVSFDEETKRWKEDSTKLDYNYIAGTGTEDNVASRWANARVTVNEVNSYFVWIPRYAYKIDSTNQKIDVKFIKNTGTIAADGTVCKYADDSTLTEDDYIIHPAFTSNADLGGGFGELAGIWIGKYEASRVDSTATEAGTSTALKVVPSVTSCRSIRIGAMYTYAKDYNTDLNSHMLKNSEWGAVAYLTHSQYGRNGNEIAVNQCSSYITGAGKASGTNSIYESSTYAYDASTFETTYSYTTELGQKTSTTGNVYGIYDMSGGSYEYAASYYNKSTSTDTSTGQSYYEANASSFASSGGTSNEYSTVYTGTEISTNYIKGDATYEISEWNSDLAGGFAWSDYPFFGHGGACVLTSTAGIFYVNDTSGRGGADTSFRICLVIK